jgi:hypothetical protein
MVVVRRTSADCMLWTLKCKERHSPIVVTSLRTMTVVRLETYLLYTDDIEKT